MSRHLFGGAQVAPPRTHVLVTPPAPPAPPSAAADVPALWDWQADEDGPLTAVAIELALAPAFAHPADSVRAAARVCRRQLEALLAQEAPR